TYGSSGNLRRQIAQGAPYALFLSANEAYVEALIEAGLTEGDGVRYARGRLVWLQPEASSHSEPLPEAQTPLAAVTESVQQFAESGELSRIAIANPDHAPYGVAARQALEHAGLWKEAQPLLVQGESVAQAAQFALSSDTRGGLVAYSLALAPELEQRSDYVLIPESWHAPLYQRMVLLPGAGETARGFYEFLQSKPARAILAEFGFAVPSE
ncbi:MAG TPA: molybdate ABC transporter substrate-binding protein, partial [Modicisalibacter sp.]|nr:molybdate ABC transporter substrate-binding protein [Modicisalibacter sp.]